jgi:hypothetical protein
VETAYAVGGEGSAACLNAGGKLEGFAGSSGSITPTLKVRAGVGCPYANDSDMGLTLTIWSEADGLERLVSSSGQSGTLSTEATRTKSPITIETTFSHVDARVRGLTSLYPSLSRIGRRLFVTQCFDRIETGSS